MKEEEERRIMREKITGMVGWKGCWHKMGWAPKKRRARS